MGNTALMLAKRKGHSDLSKLLDMYIKVGGHVNSDVGIVLPILSGLIHVYMYVVSQEVIQRT